MFDILITLGIVVAILVVFALAIRQRVGNQIHRLEKGLYGRLRETIESTDGRVAAVRDRLARAEQAAIQAKKASDALTKAQQQIAARLEPIEAVARTLKSVNFQRFERTLSESQFERFTEFWLPALKIELNRSQIAYMAQAIANVEMLASGRLATNTADEILRILVARSVRKPDAVLMEIGCLFGLNIALLHRFCSPFASKLTIVALDPLDGYYGSEHLDPLTGLPINEAIFWKNMRSAGVEDGAVRLIKEFSTSEKSLAMLADTRLDYLLIDGDHSYEGVKNDFDRFHSFVVPGGYILIDDYANLAEWPDVTRFVDEEMRGRADLEFVGADWRTAVFRKVAAK